MFHTHTRTMITTCVMANENYKKSKECVLNPAGFLCAPGSEERMADFTFKTLDLIGIVFLVTQDASFNWKQF